MEYRTITKKQACELLGVSFVTLQKMISNRLVNTCLIPATPNSYYRHRSKQVEAVLYDKLFEKTLRGSSKYVKH